MLFFENVSLALGALKSNKTRAMLTMLGIIIGIASVIAIMTVGNSMQTAMAEQMNSQGANKITIGLTKKSDSKLTEFLATFGILGDFGGPMRNLKDSDYITQDRIDGIMRKFGNRIESINYSESVGSGSAKVKDEYANVNLTGVNEGAYKSAKLELLAGRDFYESDFDTGRKVALVSDYYCDNLYKGNYESAIGKPAVAFVNNKYYTFVIVGVYKYESKMANFASSKYDTATDIYLPFATAKKLTHSKNRFSQIYVMALSIDDSIALASELKEFINTKYYRNNEDYEVTTFATQSQIKTFSSSITMMSTALSVVAGLSLLVGGIGVMNIMMVSVTERTREIGTRKALGATNASIKTQFVVEAVVLCIIGGIIGVILGIVIGMVAAKYMGYSGSPSVSSILISVGFSMATGVFFGYYPAKKAANMNPIDALRYE